MSIDGIWSSEILGLFGWEATGVVVLNQGKVIGGGTSHVSSGTYSIEGENVSVSIAVEFHGTPRTVFGATDPNFTVEGTLGLDDAVLEGALRRVDTPKQTVSYRLTRRADLP